MRTKDAHRKSSLRRRNTPTQWNEPPVDYRKNPRAESPGRINPTWGLYSPWFPNESYPWTNSLVRKAGKASGLSLMNLKPGKGSPARYISLRCDRAKVSHRAGRVRGTPGTDRPISNRQSEGIQGEPTKSSEGGEQEGGGGSRWW
ncbi:uncharacterized protein LOC107272098 [Cephus cinctus]|uniref:Uncharacterized protein LOC107272098 n=1 Tax=Cephus cinctus TaxID=211228 RepID=A0AAJ7C9M1_CEPCN|nr:uncharacterized protein LOC107272098 [Cephus cinctus]